MATRVHASVFETFTLHTDAIVGHDPSGGAAARLGLGDVASAQPTARFAALLGALHREVPMLLGVLATNDYEVLGEIREGPEQAHVLVRTTPYTTGSVTSGVEVITLAATPAGWKVREAPAIDALLVALGSFGR